MRIVIAGGTGFLGRALLNALRSDGHTVIVLTREPREPQDVGWEASSTRAPWWDAIDGADAVVNLAGAPLDAGRWTPERKASIRASRVDATRALVTAIMQARRPPGAFLSGSAVGFYGPRGSEVVDEAAGPGSDFLASVCEEWEREANAAQSTTRVVLLRTGLVLDRDGGALPRLVMPFRLGVGGPLGSGQQFWSWIHRADWVAMTRWVLEAPQVSGPLNVTAPEPATNREFARTLGRVLGRPSLVPTPAFVLRLVLGPTADALILSGQRVLPAKARANGFVFAFPVLEQSLRAIYSP